MLLVSRWYLPGKDAPFGSRRPPLHARSNAKERRRWLVLCVASSFAVCDAAPAGGMKVQRMLVSLGSLRVVRVQLPAGPKFLVIPRNSRAKIAGDETSVLCNVYKRIFQRQIFLQQSNEFLTFLCYREYHMLREKKFI